MPSQIAVFDWSLYTLPSSIPMSNIENDSHPNNPGNPGYDVGNPDWLGAAFTYNGGAPSFLEINDDDGNFEDAYVETGGAQTLAQAVTIDGTTYPVGSVVQNEFSMVDASGNEIWVVRIGGQNVGFAYERGNEPTAGDTFTGVTGRDGDGAESDDGISSTHAYGGISAVCYMPGALILTPSGERPVETLAPGDEVVTLDRGPRTIRWIGHTVHRFPPGPDKQKPIEIKAGSLGAGLPRRCLTVSPQHRLLFAHRHVKDLFGVPEVLALAKGLTGLPHVRAMNGKRRATYISMLCDRHEVILAEGAWSESFYPGPTALGMIDPRARRRIEALFPALRQDPQNGYGPTARRVLTRRETELLVARLTGREASAPPGQRDRSSGEAESGRGGDRRSARVVRGALRLVEGSAN